MDFSDTKEERAFREEAREWLGANYQLLKNLKVWRNRASQAMEKTQI
ncbi:MAG: hypothetical protein CM1200mP24_06690 [Gammaproteobacteria bacterium]|nr:MAG: hypothetical protein CM1200mP24_06690 [Gammaproteobacteria bacterium]